MNIDADRPDQMALSLRKAGRLELFAQRDKCGRPLGLPERAGIFTVGGKRTWTNCGPFWRRAQAQMIFRQWSARWQSYAFDQIDSLSQRIIELDTQIAAVSRRSQFSARLQRMPGVGPITAMALAAFAPPMDSFRQGRDFSAWLGLVPRQHSNGGKQRLGRTSKSGQRDIRRLLIIGAMAVISGARIRPPAENSWLGRILAPKPRMLAAIALANKMARMLWAMITKNEEFRGGPLMAN